MRNISNLKEQLVNDKFTKIEEAQEKIFGDMKISAADVREFSTTKAIFKPKLYDKAKNSINNISEIIQDLDELSLIEIDAISTQMRRARQLNKIKEDREVESIYDALFILAQIIPALGLISGAILFTNIFLVPLVIMLYCLLYLTNNIKVDGFFNSKNTWLFLTFTLSVVLSALAISVFTGVLTQISPFIFPTVALINVVLFVYASYREIIRDRVATDYSKVKINYVIDAYFKQRLDEHKVMHLFPKYFKKSLISDNSENKEDDLIIAKSQVIRYFMQSILRESCNNIRTIKAPWTKISYVRIMRKNIKEIAVNIILSELKKLNNQLDPELLPNLKKFCSGKDDKKIIKYFTDNGIEVKTMRDSYRDDLVYKNFKSAESKIRKYLYRDIPYYIFNVSLITISILIAIPFIPITLNAGLMITIASLVASYAIINICLRIKDYFYPKSSEHLFTSIDLMNSMRLMIPDESLVPDNIERYVNEKKHERIPDDSPKSGVTPKRKN
ncbi:MAG: hypothetical protein VX335_03830 [Pseudomonadota bacterium]|nr:hypothetical protein [Pseudomonadota bacterium]